MSGPHADDLLRYHGDEQEREALRREGRPPVARSALGAPEVDAGARDHCRWCGRPLWSNDAPQGNERLADRHVNCLRDERDMLEERFREAVDALTPYLQSGGKYAHLMEPGNSITKDGPARLVAFLESRLADAQDCIVEMIQHDSHASNGDYLSLDDHNAAVERVRAMQNKALRQRVSVRADGEATP